MKCNGKSKKLCDDDDCITCYNRSFASHEKSKEWSDKNDLSPRRISKHTHKNYIFECITCHHEFEDAPHGITKKSCPFCASKKLCDDDKCDFCYEKSFASHKMAKKWSEKNEQVARQVHKSSNKISKFDCKCGHNFEISPNYIINNNITCLYCGKHSLNLCDNDECISCYEKSFASHKYAKYWSADNDKSSREVFKSSHELYKFECTVCNHNFVRSPNKISQTKDICPYCAGTLLCDDITCKMCFMNSFAGHTKSACWSKDNDVTARQIFPSTHTMYKFNCDQCKKEYVTSPNRIMKGSWCPCQLNKTETKLLNWLVENDYNVKTQAKFKWCKNLATNKFLPFDFLLKEYNIIIELDGRQHFKQVPHWGDVANIQSNDVYKMRKALDHGYTIIRLLQEDVWFGRNNWELNLINCIQNYKIPICIYLDNKNNFYVNVKKLMAKKSKRNLVLEV